MEYGAWRSAHLETRTRQRTRLGQLHVCYVRPEVETQADKVDRVKVLNETRRTKGDNVFRTRPQSLVPKRTLQQIPRAGCTVTTNGRVQVVGEELASIPVTVGGLALPD